MKKDTLYAEPLLKIEDFKFDQRVANVFPDMIKRSIPGYSTLISNIGIIAATYFQESSTVYDLGCSLGAATQSIRHRIKSPGCTIIAVDNSAEMLEKAQSFNDMEESPVTVKFTQQDICKLDINNASVVILNFTMQFIAPEKRKELIQRIYRGMKKNGILILSEKIYFNQPKQKLINHLHLQFKKDQGYSDLEISQKRSSLENVMKLDNTETHYQRLKEAGFSQVETWYNCLNFKSFLAVK